MTNHVRNFYFVGPQCLLENRFKDKGEAIRQVVRTTLELWKLDNLEILPDGKLMARLKGGLFGLSPLSPIDREIGEIEPWQVCKETSVSNNLSLFHHLWQENSPSLERLRSACDPTDIWAAVLLEFGTVRHSLEMTTYDLLLIAFVQSHLSESFLKDAKHSALKEIVSELQVKVSKLGRNPIVNTVELRMLTTQAREKNSKITRNEAANRFAKDPRIGKIGRTRILALYDQWYTIEDWPKSAGGRPKKTVQKR